ncbi:MAG: tetratricopeptide repeat protein [Terriglobia bacterium]
MRDLYPAQATKNAVQRVGRGLRSCAVGWWSLYKEHTLAGVLILVALILAFGLVLRTVYADPVLVVAPFEVPSETPMELAVTGTTVANLLADKLRAIVRAAKAYDSYISTNFEGRPSVAPALALGQIRPPSSIGVEMGGLSLERIIQEWTRIRQRQNVVIGGVVFSRKKFTLRARIAGQGSWAIEKDATAEGLESACSELALNLLSDYRPRIAGLFHESEGKYKLALDMYRAWATREPKNVKTHIYLAGFLYDQGNFDGAIAAYKKAIKLKPDFPEAHNNLGNALVEKFDEFIRGLADQSQLAAYRDVVLADKDLLGDAIAAYQKAIKLKSNFPEALNNLAAALVRTGRLDEAIATYRKALELTPDDPEALNNLGNALARKGQFDEAIERYRKALELTPEDHDILNSLGNALARKGQLDDAIATFQKALELKPADPETLINLEFAKAQRLNPKFRPLTDGSRK